MEALEAARDAAAEATGACVFQWLFFYALTRQVISTCTITHATHPFRTPLIILLLLTGSRVFRRLSPTVDGGGQCRKYHHCARELILLGLR